MTSNIGILDRTLRIVAGLALISLVFVGPQTLWGLLGLIPLVTGLARVCPAYRVAGVSTCAHDRC
jgi:cadmium resistance protein CadD (predicted permease)